MYQRINSVKNIADDAAMKYPDTVILLFAKAPVAGKVNTRLIADIGVRAATLLQRDLIDQRL